MGFIETTETAPIDVPVGMEVIGLWGGDRKILEIAKQMEAVLGEPKLCHRD